MTQDIDETATLTESEADPSETELALIGDPPIVLDDCESANTWSLVPNFLSFNSGGNQTVLAGDTVTGNNSGANAYVEFVDKDGGNWASGNAYGTFWLSKINGNFLAETLNRGNNTDVCTIGGAPVVAANTSLILDTTEFTTGNGSIKITFGPNPGGNVQYPLIRCVANAANFASPMSYLKFEHKGGGVPALPQISTLFFGENSYQENRISANNANTGSWNTFQQDISNVADANRNAVTEFALILKSGSGYNNSTVNIDYIRASSGPRQLKGSDGERAFLVYPKAYFGSYNGTNANLTITIPRKGAPSLIEWLADGKMPFIWFSGMGNSNVFRANAANDCSMNIITTALVAVGDCYFTVAGGLSTSALKYFYKVLWND
jgi:hypothetical protein